MNQKTHLSILEFSRLTGIKRENLRFYDRIGLLSPDMRGENNYRYYSRHQLNSAYLISSLRSIGIGIEDIKQYSLTRTPEKSLALFDQQDARIQAEIEHLQETRLIMKLHFDMIKEALAHEKDALFLLEKEPEPIFLCPPFPDGLDEDEGEMFSYDYADAKGINLGYPLGAKLTWNEPESDSAPAAMQYYFKTAEHSNSTKPAGLYAVAYGSYDPWHSQPLYLRLQDFIRDQGLHICRTAYEEYPLSDISAPTTDYNCIRLEIPVTRNKPAE